MTTATSFSSADLQTRFTGPVPAAFIRNEWRHATDEDARLFERIDPRTGVAVGALEFASVAMADEAIEAAQHSFPAFSQTSLADRMELLKALRVTYEAHLDDMGAAISAEMGAPLDFAIRDQAGAGLAHIDAAIDALPEIAFEYEQGGSLILREPIGVTALITPWNWPANQIACKVAPALAAGCTMILKPSEYAPLSAAVFADIIHEAGIPDGVFNMVFGDGPVIGHHLASHPDIDMVSFTGSHRGGVAVSEAAAPTIKRVVQELGGKSANILLDDLSEDAFADAVSACIAVCFMNAGQSCDAPSRLLVPQSRLQEAEDAAIAAVKCLSVGAEDDADYGPLINQAQYEHVTGLIEKGIAESCRCISGGLGLPGDLTHGFYIRPTVFSGVMPDHTLARSEVFGPVLAIMAYDGEADAVSIANDSVYGLSGYVGAASRDRAINVARQMRTGMVMLNGAPLAFDAPFGGYRQSGNGREWGHFGIQEFLETKAILGYNS